VLALLRMLYYLSVSVLHHVHKRTLRRVNCDNNAYDFLFGFVRISVVIIGRTWPMALTTGFGIGVAYADCQRTFNPIDLPGIRVIKNSKAK